MSHRAPGGITQAVPSCCFVFFLYPFSTSMAVLKLAVEQKGQKNLSSQVSVWIRWPLHFSALNWLFSSFHTNINPAIHLSSTSPRYILNKEYNFYVSLDQVSLKSQTHITLFWLIGTSGKPFFFRFSLRDPISKKTIFPVSVLQKWTHPTFTTIFVELFIRRRWIIESKDPDGF